jgi:hypothetical protein
VFGLSLAVIAIALPDSVNPSLIATVAYLAVGPRGTRSTAVFALAAFGATLLGGIAIALGLANPLISLVPKPHRTLRNALVVAGGAALLVGGAVIWIRRRSLAGRQPPGTARAGRSAALLGVGIAGFELITAFPYFAAIALVTASSASSAGKLYLLVLYNVFYALPLFAIAIVRAYMGPRAQGVLSRVSEWILSKWPIVVAPLAAAVGIGLMTYGVAALASGG